MLQKIAKFFERYCHHEYVYHLDSGLVVNIIPESSGLAHLIGLQKYTDIPLLRRFNDKQDTDVNGSNVFTMLDEAGITIADLKMSKYYISYKDRLLHFTDENVFELLYNTRIFKFEQGAAKNKKAEYGLLRSKQGLHLQLIVGSETYHYYLNSFYVSRRKDKNFAKFSQKVDLFQVYELGVSGKELIYERNYKTIKSKKSSIEDSIKEYNLKNNTFHQAYHGDNSCMLDELNTMARIIREEIRELEYLCQTETSFTREAGKKILSFKGLLESRRS